MFQGPEDESNFGIFDLFEPSAVQGCCNNPELEDNIKSDTAVAGLCGFANFANTCYMNSGLQCLLATPTVVKYFTECYKSKKGSILQSSVSAKKYFRINFFPSSYCGKVSTQKQYIHIHL
jgi:ubiquitin C-terminal hydrolase